MFVQKNEKKKKLLLSGLSLDVTKKTTLSGRKISLKEYFVMVWKMQHELSFKLTWRKECRIKSGEDICYFILSCFIGLIPCLVLFKC